jgi:hypothetical protein
MSSSLLDFIVPLRPDLSNNSASLSHEMRSYDIGVQPVNMQHAVNYIKSLITKFTPEQLTSDGWKALFAPFAEKRYPFGVNNILNINGKISFPEGSIVVDAFYLAERMYNFPFGSISTMDWSNAKYHNSFKTDGSEFELNLKFNEHERICFILSDYTKRNKMTSPSLHTQFNINIKYYNMQKKEYVNINPFKQWFQSAIIYILNHSTICPLNTLLINVLGEMVLSPVQLNIH